MNRFVIIAMLSAGLHVAHAQAADNDAKRFAFNAFGTFGVIHSDYEHADFVTSAYLHPRGVGYTNNWSVDQDTKLGLQFSADITDGLSAVIQVVSQQRYDNTFTPTLEWANIKYQLTPELSIRVGRVLLPTFLTSDIRNIGYVNQWLRTPGEVLIQMPNTNSDGVDLTYLFNVGAIANRLQVLYGDSTVTATGGVDYESSAVRALVDTIEYGPLTVHLGYQKMHYNAAQSYDPTAAKTSFESYEIAAMYDPGGWYVIGEILRADDAVFGKAVAWYAGGGYRIRKFTPYLFHAVGDQTRVGESGYEPIFDQKTSGLGLRWDFKKNLAAKIQYERATLGSLLLPSSFVNVQPDARIGDHAHIFSATLDFVW